MIVKQTKILVAVLVNQYILQVILSEQPIVHLPNIEADFCDASC